MPRLKDYDYLERHLLLKRTWQKFQVVFGILTPAQQWDFHRFFQTKSELQPAELVEIREELAQHDPGLPQRAGSAFRKLDVMFRHVLEESQGDPLRFNRAVLSYKEPLIKRKYRINGVTVAKQEPDLRRFSLVLLQMAREAVV